jgi:hypothetical protein
LEIKANCYLFGSSTKYRRCARPKGKEKTTIKRTIRIRIKADGRNKQISHTAR